MAVTVLMSVTNWKFKSPEKMVTAPLPEEKESI